MLYPLRMCFLSMLLTTSWSVFAQAKLSDKVSAYLLSSEVTVQFQDVKVNNAGTNSLKLGISACEGYRDYCEELLILNQIENKASSHKDLKIKISELKNGASRIDLRDPKSFFRFTGYQTQTFGKRKISTLDVKTQKLLSDLALSGGSKEIQLPGVGNVDVIMTVKLNQVDGDPAAILKKDLSPLLIVDLLHRDSTPSEREALIRAVDTIQSQFKCTMNTFMLDKLEPFVGKDLKSLMTIISAYPASSGDELKETLKSLSFQDKAINFALELNSHSVVTDYFSEAISRDEARAQIDATAHKLQMDTRDYYQLELLYYNALSSGQAETYKKNFIDPHYMNCYVPSTPLYEKLERAFDLSDRRNLYYSQLSEYEAYLKIMNQHRASIGLKPLIYHAIVEKHAQKHTDNMAWKVVPFGHQDLALRCQNLKAEAGTNRDCSEIVAAGQQDVETLLWSWLSSPGHRAVIEDPRFTHTAISRSFGSGSIFWTQMFLEIK